jgi:peptidoglycan hydrolase CwlO-like protein
LLKNPVIRLEGILLPKEEGKMLIDKTEKIFELKQEKKRLDKVIKDWKKEIKEHQKEIGYFTKEIINLNAKIEKINHEITLWEGGKK